MNFINHLNILTLILFFFSLCTKFAKLIKAYIVGEHGDSSVALWSSISVGGGPILSFLEKQQIAFEKTTLENIHKEVIESAYEVIRLKAYTSWAIGYSLASLARTILRDQRRIHVVSVLAKGFYEINGGDVFFSLPTQFGRNGVLGVTNIHITDEEAQQLRESLLYGSLWCNMVLAIFKPLGQSESVQFQPTRQANRMAA
ncbi:L-lactate dehydrogenase B-like [Malania oleifera]|uniref:L-lactate dehydrogenase B-like n=1 Tax=Malania oleifera TaxID=397392 RepID=UPI0025AEBD45|nr:L-lactate dehydrogenase B-like [Malania oleifera]